MIKGHARNSQGRKIMFTVKKPTMQKIPGVFLISLHANTVGLINATNLMQWYYVGDR